MYVLHTKLKNNTMREEGGRLLRYGKAECRKVSGGIAGRRSEEGGEGGGQKGG